MAGPLHCAFTADSFVLHSVRSERVACLRFGVSAAVGQREYSRWQGGAGVWLASVCLLPDRTGREGDRIGDGARSGSPHLPPLVHGVETGGGSESVV